ncbi:Sodium/hydrogen exchanger family-domain-containing protein [Lophiotrema nucula]|uniref:Sodium/hydrogen exchanger family-domain-containing protein n=1 Tax=Lophiotrema nucula TaxID=690887 RepID=A0A6A5YWG6_9PLEO|nr:Sodium/hydrogen exchanger family-domain-containing protein [Lophiotrema nucula]
MAWEHLSITKPHLVYIILGGFTSLFMLCSSVIKERLYIGEATIATICGIIFGPHAADLINPLEWGNTDLITLEFSRIVLVVQCFAVGVELPRAYMEKHWKSVTLLLVPVMTFGWLMTSLFVWWMFGSHLNWLDSLTVAACVTATDPVLASSVVGKGKFAKRVPKHLRDLLSAESGCNDGMAFPFVYLALYLIRYRPDANKVAFHWFCYTILYECVFGAFYGVLVGYIARRLIRAAHEKDLIDRESFLVFYFVLALFCAGSGSLLGMDDLLVGFACGVGFSNDGWFLEKTEESHVSNVIDLLINLAFFVYFGTIIPWEQFNSPEILGITPWRLVVLGILVLFFRRIPIMLALKPIIPDIKTWREALFAGHFGPIGVGGIFVAILARAELETEETTPLAVLPEPGFEHLNIIELIWPITCFLVICSILVHGSSIAVFTLGKHINTLTISLSYTRADEEGPRWMERLPRIQSRSRSSMSLGRRPSESSIDEKPEKSGPSLLPVSLPAGFLRRQKEEEAASRASSAKPGARRRKWDYGRGPGGPVSQSAITPSRRNLTESEATSPMQDSDTLAVPSDESPESSLTKEKAGRRESEEEIYQEGDKTVIEDEEGNVLGIRDKQRGESPEDRRAGDNAEARRLMREKDVEHGVAQTEHGGELEEAPSKIMSAVKEGVEHPTNPARWKKGWDAVAGRRRGEATGEPSQPPRAARPPQKRGPALAYQFGNTIIVEDEDGEVLKKYDIPAPAKESRPGGMDRKSSVVEQGGRALQSLRRMGTYVGMPGPQTEAGPSGTADDARAEATRKKKQQEDEEDDRIRFTVTAGGRRMSKLEFIQQMSQMEPKTRAKFVENSDVPEGVKQDARQDAKDADRRGRAASHANIPPVVGEESEAQIQKTDSPGAEREHRKQGPSGLTLVDSDEEDIPFHPVRDHLASFSMGHSNKETAAQRRRRLADQATPRSPVQEEDSENEQDPTKEEETPAERRRRLAALQGSSSSPDRDRQHNTERSVSPSHAPKSRMDEGETEAERRRRLGALGIGNSSSPSDSESDEEETGDPMETGRGTNSQASYFPQPSSSQPVSPAPRTPGIRFAEQPRIPTKDERKAAEEEEERQKREGSGGESSRRIGFGKLRIGKAPKKEHFKG